MTTDRVAGEYIVASIRPHAGRLVWSALALIVLAFAVPMLWGRVGESWWNPVVVAVAAGLAFVLVVVPLVAWASRRTVLTTRRIVLRGGIGGSRREVPLARIHDIEVRRTGVQRLVGAGDLLLSTGGRVVRIGDVPGPLVVSAAIVELMEEAGFAPAQSPHSDAAEGRMP